MRTTCAPTYANIFMSEFENRYIFHLIKNKSSSYPRFIDDIFMVWTKSKYQLKSFINEIDKKHHSIKLDFNFSKEIIEFLDALVCKDRNNILQTTLSYKANWPLSLEMGIPYSQALRIKLVCSTFDDTKSILMAWLNDLWKKCTKKTLKNKSKK